MMTTLFAHLRRSNKPRRNQSVEPPWSPDAFVGVVFDSQQQWRGTERDDAGNTWEVTNLKFAIKGDQHHYLEMIHVPTSWVSTLKHIKLVQYAKYHQLALLGMVPTDAFVVTTTCQMPNIAIKTRRQYTIDALEALNCPKAVIDFLT